MVSALAEKILKKINNIRFSFQSYNVFNLAKTSVLFRTHFTKIALNIILEIDFGGFSFSRV